MYKHRFFIELTTKERIIIFFSSLLYCSFFEQKNTKERRGEERRGEERRGEERR
jgi:hypothetical protein